MTFGISAPIQAYAAGKIAAREANLVIFVLFVVSCILTPPHPGPLPRGARERTYQAASVVMSPLPQGEGQGEGASINA